MKLKLSSLMIGLLLVASWAQPLPAMYQQLTKQQKKEAMSYGQRSAMADITEFLEEWVVVLDEYKGYAFMITEFLALANASKDSILTGVPLNSFNMEDAMTQSRDKFVFRVTTFGDTIRFAKDYTAVLKAGNQVIPTTYWNNDEGEAFGDGKVKPAFQADSEFFFPAEGIASDSQIALIVQDKDGNTVTQFNFDLSKMR